MDRPSLTAFEDHLGAVFGAFRGSLISLLSGAGLSATEPQEMARQLGISRNLTWKISKVAGTADMFQAFLHLPGDEGLEIFVSAVQRRGGSSNHLAAFNGARQEFERLVARHAGDRATFDLILDGMGGRDAAERLEHSRKLAFRGNSGVWGAQARARSTTVLVLPNGSEPERVDVAMLGGLVDLRRLRPRTPWPIFYKHSFDAQGNPDLAPPPEEPLDPASPDRANLLREFCSKNLPAISTVPTPGGVEYVLDSGPIGNLGKCTCFFGSVFRGRAGRFRTAGDTHAEFVSHIHQPTETLQFDVIVDERLGLGRDPEVLIRGKVGHAGSAHSGLPLPFLERAVELPGPRPALESPWVPDYGRLIEWTLSRLGADPALLRAHRLVMKFPPMHATVSLRYELPSRS
ncbi:MAG: hypothetical protein DYG92_10190 [Leptolyngbya sp. PLA1]|nr:hypothetical protein [Leptolyngbya sp. PLA1]